MLEDHKSAAVGKCDIRLCKSLVIQEFKCTKCGRACHQACCKGLISEVKDKPPLPALPEGSICHTKNVARSLSRMLAAVNEVIGRPMANLRLQPSLSSSCFWIGGQIAPNTR